MTKQTYCLCCAQSTRPSLGCSLCGGNEVAAAMLQIVMLQGNSEDKPPTHIAQICELCQEDLETNERTWLDLRRRAVPCFRFALVCRRCETPIATASTFAENKRLCRLAEVAQCVQESLRLQIFNRNGIAWQVCTTHGDKMSPGDWDVRCDLQCSVSGCWHAAWRCYQGYCEDHWIMQLLKHRTPRDVAGLVLEYGTGYNRQPARAFRKRCRHTS